MLFKLGETVEAKSANQQWCQGQVLQIDLDDNEVLVRLKGPSVIWEEWINFKCVRKLNRLPMEKPKTPQNFKVGEQVMAKWKNQPKPFPAQILAYDVESDSYQIRFYDGFVKTYKSSRIQKMTEADKERLMYDPPPEPVLEPLVKSVFDTTGLGTKEERRARNKKLDVASLFKNKPFESAAEDTFHDNQVSHSARRRRTSSVNSFSSVSSFQSDDKSCVFPVATNLNARDALTPVFLEKAARRERSKRFSVTELFSPLRRVSSPNESTAYPRTYAKTSFGEIRQRPDQTSVAYGNPKSSGRRSAAIASVTLSSDSESDTPEIVSDLHCGETKKKYFNKGGSNVQTELSKSMTEPGDTKATKPIAVIEPTSDEIQLLPMLQPRKVQEEVSLSLAISKNNTNEKYLKTDELKIKKVEAGLLDRKNLMSKMQPPDTTLPKFGISKKSPEETLSIEEELKLHKDEPGPVDKKYLAKKVEPSKMPTQIFANLGIAALKTEDKPPMIEELDTRKVEAELNQVNASEGITPNKLIAKKIIINKDIQAKVFNEQVVQCVSRSDSPVSPATGEIFLHDPVLPEGWMKRIIAAKKILPCHSFAKKWSVSLISPCGARFYSRKSIADYLVSKNLNIPISSFNFALGPDLLRQLGKIVRNPPKKVRKPQEKPVISRSIPRDDSFVPTPNDFICPGRMCTKSFRSALLLHMHIKHQHPDISNMDIKLPKVADLAYARTSGDEDLVKTKGLEESTAMSFSAQFQQFLAKREEILAKSESSMIVIEEPEADVSNVVVEAVEESEDLVHCKCGFYEEDGLMIQCDICLCWHHGVCFGIIAEEEVPDRFTCNFCSNPKKVRRSMRVSYDENWLKDGTLARLAFVDKRNEHANPKRIMTLQKTHTALGESLEIGNILAKLSKQVDMSKNKDHPKLYLWAGSGKKCPKNGQKEGSSQERLEDLPIMASQESGDFFMDELPDDALDTSFFENSDISALLPTSSELEQMSVELNQKGIPQAEDRINNDDCLGNLVSHIEESHAEVESRLEALEKLADALEKETELGEFSSPELQTLIQDVEQLSQLSSFS
ncbi:PHD finger protein 20-like isoform X1 [Artemia franciscana]